MISLITLSFNIYSRVFEATYLAKLRQGQKSITIIPIEDHAKISQIDGTNIHDIHMPLPKIVYYDFGYMVPLDEKLLDDFIKQIIEVVGKNKFPHGDVIRAIPINDEYMNLPTNFSFMGINFGKVMDWDKQHVSLIRNQQPNQTVQHAMYDIVDQFGETPVDALLTFYVKSKFERGTTRSDSPFTFIKRSVRAIFKINDRDILIETKEGNVLINRQSGAFKTGFKNDFIDAIRNEFVLNILQSELPDKNNVVLAAVQLNIPMSWN